MYGGYAVCMILAFVYPSACMYVLGVISVVLIVGIFTGTRKS